MMNDQYQYVGFWARVLAAFIDSFVLVIVLLPISLVFTDALLAQVIGLLLPAVLVIILWLRFQATPGKMAIKARIIDAKTGAPPNTQQCIVRYLGYYVSSIPLGLGLVWVAFDPRKQGWHDKLARTLVIRG